MIIVNACQSNQCLKRLSPFLSRSQKDIEGKKDIKLSIEAERKFFLRFGHFKKYVVKLVRFII